MKTRRDLFGTTPVADPAPAAPCTISVTEAARMLGVSRPTVYSAIRAGQLPSVKVGHRILIPRVPFLALLQGAAA